MEYVLLIVIGLMAGTLGGLLGVGGSVIMIPAMVWIFSIFSGAPENIHQYQAAAMIVNFLLIGPAAYRHFKAHAVVMKVWKWMAPADLIGIVVGVAISRLAIFTGENQVFMKQAFGLFILYVAAYNAWKLWGPAPEQHEMPENFKVHAPQTMIVGLLMGFASGLLGIGGGALAVPALQVVIRLPLRNAIATSAMTIFSVSWLGAVVKNASLGNDGTVARSLVLAACLAPTAMIGGYFGGHLTHKLPLKAVRLAFIVLMTAAGIKMMGWF